MVTRDAFEALVEDAYQDAHAFILRNEDYLKQEVDAFASAKPLAA